MSTMHSGILTKVCNRRLQPESLQRMDYTSYNWLQIVNISITVIQAMKGLVALYTYC